MSIPIIGFQVDLNAMLVMMSTAKWTELIMLALLLLYCGACKTLHEFRSFKAGLIGH